MALPTRVRTALMVVAGFIAGVLLGAFSLWAADHGADAGDLVGFLGGVCGTGLAVAGTLWLDRRRRNASQRDDRTAVLELLTDFEAEVARQTSCPLSEETGMVAVSRISLLADELDGALTFLERVPSKTSRLAILRRLHWLLGSMRAASARMREIESGQVSDATAIGCWQVACSYADSLKGPIAQVRDEVTQVQTL